ncbi:hypothetical protein EST38_g13068 [Candolleomyces aberdarensis]|uniref:Nephrocystin 3-like N-terminal domain-containing protein n=1 Tax=Candolleomyces aberdarensis TaxID=2316362 RepID=A0A4V1Q1U3_9AGAR|nr:hypothetical protein EST38_g13068 [Candolleomyces aberdarensis]
MATTFFPDARDFQVGTLNFNFTSNSHSSSAGGPLKELASRVAVGAIHDSAERCDAPKCQPETRVAVQDDLYSWIVDGDRESEPPKKMTWVTGPAGSGKSAVMGSLAERCAPDGLLGATFFFTSWSASIGRRRKTAFVTTIAHQLAEHREDLKNAISNAIENKPSIFEKNLHTQMETLVLAPLREVALQSDRPGLRGAIIIDGVDECEAEQYHDTTSAGTWAKLIRANAQDQLEILQVLRAASSDPSFPFRILVASRPERVFREFFDPENDAASFAKKLDLHEDYNADVDINLFFEVHFTQIRRRYNLPPSWPPPGAIRTLVENASGQFIYAATVIRFLDMGLREPPKVLLEAILEAGTRVLSSNPLEQLDVLYSHILESGPDPPRSVLWIRAMELLSLSTAATNLFLEADPGSNEGEHLLGNLHSLIRIPRTSDTTHYGAYHKSLFDFLEDPGRCGKLYLEESEICAFIWDQFICACASSVSSGSAHSKVLPTPASVDWFMIRARGIIASRRVESGAVAFSVIWDRLLGSCLACCGPPEKWIVLHNRGLRG